MINMDKLEILIEQLKDGQSCLIANLRIGIESEFIMFVTGWSKYSDTKWLSKEIALQELSGIKEEFCLLRDAIPQLNKLSNNKIIRYNLVFNYGMGSIGVCHMINGKVFWDIDLVK